MVVNIDRTVPIQYHETSLGHYCVPQMQQDFAARDNAVGMI